VVASARWPRLGAAALGFAWFLHIGGAPVLNPSNYRWLLAGDWTQHWLGWSFFRSEPWTFPIGTISSLLYPVGTSIGFTDSNPLVSLLLRPIAPWLPQDFQFIGLWLALCFVMQGYVGAALTSTVTKDPGQQVLGGFLFVLSPVLVARLGHDTLCAHWLVLAMLYFGLRSYDDPARTRGVGWLLIATVMLASAVHPYLAAMCFALGQACLVRLWRIGVFSGWRALGVAAAMTVGMIAVFGAIGYIGAAHIGSGGFGIYSADILALVHSAGYSFLLPEFWLAPGRTEGVGFLGLGALIGVGLAMVVLIKLRPRRVVIWPIVGACVVMFVYALSSDVTVASRSVVHLGFYELASTFTAAFRASGRFVWPLHYLFLLLAVWGAVRIAGAARQSGATALMAVLVILQILDFRTDPSWSAPQRFREVPTANFSGAVGAYRHLEMVPMRVLGFCGGDYDQAYISRYMLLASRLKMTFNSGIFARVAPDPVRQACVRQDQALDAGVLDARTVYVVVAAYLDTFRRAGASCARFDGDWICVSRDSDPSFRRYLDGGAAVK